MKWMSEIDRSCKSRALVGYSDNEFGRVAELATGYYGIAGREQKGAEGSRGESRRIRYRLISQMTVGMLALGNLYISSGLSCSLPLSFSS